MINTPLARFHRKMFEIMCDLGWPLNVIVNETLRRHGIDAEQAKNVLRSLMGFIGKIDCLDVDRIENPKEAIKEARTKCFARAFFETVREIVGDDGFNTFIRIVAKAYSEEIKDIKPLLRAFGKYIEMHVEKDGNRVIVRAKYKPGGEHFMHIMGVPFPALVAALIVLKSDSIKLVESRKNESEEVFVFE